MLSTRFHYCWKETSSAVGSYRILYLGVGETFPYPGWEFSTRRALFSAADESRGAASDSGNMPLLLGLHYLTFHYELYLHNSSFSGPHSHLPTSFQELGALLGGIYSSSVKPQPSGQCQERGTYKPGLWGQWGALRLVTGASPAKLSHFLRWPGVHWLLAPWLVLESPPGTENQQEQVAEVEWSTPEGCITELNHIMIIIL